LVIATRKKELRRNLKISETAKSSQRVGGIRLRSRRRHGTGTGGERLWGPRLPLYKKTTTESRVTVSGPILTMYPLPRVQKPAGSGPRPGEASIKQRRSDTPRNYSRGIAKVRAAFIDDGQRQHQLGGERSCTLWQGYVGGGRADSFVKKRHLTWEPQGNREFLNLLGDGLEGQGSSRIHPLGPSTDAIRVWEKVLRRRASEL